MAPEIEDRIADELTKARLLSWYMRRQLAEGKVGDLRKVRERSFSQVIAHAGI